MKSLQNKLFLCLVLGVLFTACAQDKKKKTISPTPVSLSSEGDFEITLSKSFYMTGDKMDDLYIQATVNKGILVANTPIEIVKKDNPSEKISGTIYRLDDAQYQPVKKASAGETVTLYLKVSNDKGFALGYTGDLYTIVKKGQKSTASPSVSKAKVVVMVNGKAWKYDYYHVYHYTKDFGITKNPANYLIVFTKKNKNLKNAPEEVLQISLFHAPKAIKTFEKGDIDLSFTSDMFGEERVYSKTFKAEEAASAVISEYTVENGKTFISGDVKTICKQFLCGSCTKIPIEISFTKLAVTVDNN